MTVSITLAGMALCIIGFMRVRKAVLNGEPGLRIPRPKAVDFGSVGMLTIGLWFMLMAGGETDRGLVLGFSAWILFPGVFLTAIGPWVACTRGRGILAGGTLVQLGTIAGLLGGGMLAMVIAQGLWVGAGDDLGARDNLLVIVQSAGSASHYLAGSGVWMLAGGFLRRAASREWYWA